MSLYKPKNTEFWHYDFQLKGRRFHGSTKTGNRNKAKEVEASVREKARRELLLGEKPPMTVDEAFGQYYQEVSQYRACGPTDYRDMSRILPSLGASKFIHEIDDAVIAAHVAKRRGDVNRNHKTKTPLSPRRINADVELLRRIWKRAEKTWKVNVGSPPDWSGHLLPVENERQRELSEEEETRLFKALRPDFHALVYAAMRLGVRVSGLRGLTWSDVDLKAQTLTVTLKGSRGAPGRRSRKPIPSDVLQVIANEKSHHPIFVFTYECMKSRGERKRGDRYPFSLNGWRKAWTDALAKAEIEDFRFHDLRHTAASRLLRVTQNLRLTQVALDHRTIQTTTRYAHILDDDLRDGLELAKSRKIPEAVAEADPNALPEKKKRA